jgi:transcriptional regulator GlxA family with amidase domain
MNPKSLRVLILAYDGVEALDFAGPFEVFTTASRVAQRMQPGTAAPFEVASVAQASPVQARAGLRLLADHTLEDSPKADVLVVPGGVIDAPMASPGTLRWIADDAAVVDPAHAFAHIVERLAGRELAERTALQMDYAWTRNSNNTTTSNPSA